MQTKLWLIRHSPWWVLRALWKLGVIRRTTIFRWEMNAALDEWA